MGCDGGSIPKRKEVVKNKERQPRKQRAAGVDCAERWKQCAICDWILKKPIVAGHYGHLFCKECIIEFLIEVRRDSLQSYDLRLAKLPALDTVHSLKDVKELKLAENTDSSSSSSNNGGDDTIRADFVCPITNLETNGKYKFMFSWNCGCVVSERAIKEVADEKKCLVCQVPYEGQWDLVTLNPDSKDLKENQAKFMARKMSPHLKELGGKKVTSSQETTSSSSSSQNYMGPSTSTGRRPKSKRSSQQSPQPPHDRPSTSGSQSKRHKS